MLYEPGMSCRLYVCVNLVHCVMLCWQINDDDDELLFSYQFFSSVHGCFTVDLNYFRTRLHEYNNKKAQLSLVQPTVLVVNNLQGHPRSLFFISSERVYAFFISD